MRYVPKKPPMLSLLPVQAGILCFAILCLIAGIIVITIDRNGTIDDWDTKIAPVQEDNDEFTATYDDN